ALGGLDGIVPVAAEGVERRLASIDRDLARPAVADLVTALVQEDDAITRCSEAHRAGANRPGDTRRAGIADEDARQLRLAVHVVERDSQIGLGPGDDVGAECLAAACQRSQVQSDLAPWLRPGRPERSIDCRRAEEIRDAVL